MGYGSDTEEKIKSNCAEISRLLFENENLIRSMGYHVPDRNYVLSPEDRISIPSIYIRKKAWFIDAYRLDDLCQNPVVRDNIAYHLQYTDFVNYLANRFCLWGSLNPLFFQEAVMLVVSITEAMLSECADRIRKNCNRCAKQCKRINKRRCNR